MADFSPLLEWWTTEGRDLPWRRTRDPWAVLVSELMLQQTQVPRVVDRWRLFLGRFPDPATCAAASPGDVVAAWRGLGYNRRAVNLHRAATAVVARHDGRIPDDLAALLALPGIGPYTARAVLVFAYGRDLGLVDTNAGRFLARAGSGQPLGRRSAQDLADGLVPSRSGAGPGGRRCSTWARWSAPGPARPAGAARWRRVAPGTSRGDRNPIRWSARLASAGPSPGSRAPTGRVAADWSMPCGTVPSPSPTWPWWPGGPAMTSGPNGLATAWFPTDWPCVTTVTCGCPDASVQWSAASSGVEPE